MVALVVDRAIKVIALYTNPGDALGVGFYYSLNTTGPLSLPLSANFLLTFGVLAMAVLVYMGRRTMRSARHIAFLGVLLMLVGGASNLFDRLTVGGVIDTYHLTLWGTLSFNLADWCLMIGMALVVVDQLPLPKPAH